MSTRLVKGIAMDVATEMAERAIDDALSMLHAADSDLEQLLVTTALTLQLLSRRLSAAQLEVANGVASLARVAIEDVREKGPRS